MGIKAARHSASGAEGPWEDLLASVLKRRSYDARFYKPVCLIAVIDAVEAGEIAVSDIDPHRVIERFGSYVRPVFPDRAMMGWRPFWHLSNDGAWRFRREGRTVGPEAFGAERKPNSHSRLLSNIDHVAVPNAMRAYWRDRSSRADLRQALIAMLETDDAECQATARVLAGAGAPFLDSVDPDIPAPAPRAGASGQGFLSSTATRVAVKDQAMCLARAHLEKMAWTVEDVSKHESYDFRCCRAAGEILCVEVKGTTSAGEAFQITRAEVAFARSNAMALIVVSNIVLTDDGSFLGATGGTVEMYAPWRPDPSRLTPISYMYRLR